MNKRLQQLFLAVDEKGSAALFGRSTAFSLPIGDELRTYKTGPRYTLYAYPASGLINRRVPLISKSSVSTWTVASNTAFLAAAGDSFRAAS